jgi:hypothetical protein
MDLKIKLLEAFEGSYYLIVIAQGKVDSAVLKRLFAEVEKITEPLLHCKVFIDLEEARLNVRAAAVHAIVTQLELHSKSHLGKMAVVSSEFEPCGRLQLLRDLLCSRGFRVAVFDNTTSAGEWLSEATLTQEKPSTGNFFEAVSDR